MYHLGVYSRELNLQYAVKSLGITTLGVVGETQKGPAFQPMMVENWRDFTSMFGGTSTEKFAGSQYPKYELPYIAKSYLSESNQLQVCRVLGMSGYNAGPAWVITADGKDKKHVVAVIRSRAYYEEYYRFPGDSATTVSCDCPQQTFDTLFYKVGEIKRDTRDCTKPVLYNENALKIDQYIPLGSSGNECTNYQFENGAGNWGVSTVNHGQFKLCGWIGAHVETEKMESSASTYFEYAVTLNPNDKNYILKVLGTDPQNGEAPIYVESLYDVALGQLIEEGEVSGITSGLTFYQAYRKADYCTLTPVDGFVTKQERALSRKDVGKRFLATSEAATAKIKCHEYGYDTNKPTKETDVAVGQIYTVAQYTDSEGKRHYYYKYYNASGLTSLKPDTSGTSIVAWTKYYSILDKIVDTSKNTSNGGKLPTLVRNNEDGRYYRMKGTDEVVEVTCDLNDYKESYRFASTPWIVSSIKGDAEKMELNKLFRFHTISDGNSANNEIKVSIQNIRPDNGTFDVIVRDINDVDESIVAYEKFGNCTLVPGDSNYIAYKIGSFDGAYESKSKYITVEVNENLITKNSTPAGFLGYPYAKFDGVQILDSTETTNATAITKPYIKYNQNYDEDVKHRKQYFGLSSIVGVDVDMFTYKGKTAYSQDPESITNGFHLDCRLANTDAKITVDGESGYTFDVASINNRTNILNGMPVIGTEEEMEGSIYEFTDLRKFTVYFYGGFDGWDAYRTYRSNTDDFKMTKYRGDYNDYSGEGYSFNKIENAEALGLNQEGITSDWYAYLTAYRQFSNPESVDINVFATPGIDLVNNKLLTQEVIEMIEEERADSIYVATMPDKPFGASDYADEMYTPEDAVYELEDTEIDSNYTCTYYPWIKYEDVDNSQYIMLPPTKDVVRNMAKTDNTAHPWFAPAGIDRGDVNCVKAHYITKLADEDVLYDGRINPIKTFASDGVKIWGQKNLQVADNQLNRIAVRRLMLRMRKLIAIACVGLIFEPNDATTKNKFLSTITPILDNIKSNRGITDYKIEVNDTIESRERRELPAKIFIKPTNVLEYITLDFVITPESVNFSDI